MADKKIGKVIQKAKPVSAKGGSASGRKKTAVKPAKVSAKSTESAAVLDATKGIRATVVGVDGKSAGSVTLPAQYFGAKVNKQLIATAVRIYLANQRVGQAKTKTRGEVEGSTRKIYKQKGTGRARHGGIRAPIFVGGGIVFGPQPRDYSLKFPQKMKRAALASALSWKLAEGNVIIVSGLSDLKPKTKVMAQALAQVKSPKSSLLVISKDADMVARGTRNIEGVDVVHASDVHTYGVMTHEKVVLMKEALAAFK